MCVFLTFMFSFFLSRMKIENATLKESMESIEHLTSSIRRLRLTLLEVILFTLSIEQKFLYLDQGICC